MVNRLTSLQARCSVSNKVILFFIDGVGIGANDPEYNPCCYSKTGIFHFDKATIPFGGKRFTIDAQLGVPGLPQSATGHTTLYTGLNAPKIIGKHLFGFPNQDLRRLLQEYSIFVRLINKGYSCKFINAFRPIFFTTPEIFKNLHMSATTEMNRYVNLSFADFNQVRNREALYHDYTNKEIIEKGFDLPLYTPENASEILANESKKYDLILYEYFLTDFAGHTQDLNRAIREIEKVENFIIGVLKRINLADTTLIVVSDHGNIEDLRTKSHTKNPAFLAIWEKTSADDKIKFKSLLDIFPYLYYKITGELI